MLLRLAEGGIPIVGPVPESFNFLSLRDEIDFDEQR